MLGGKYFSVLDLEELIFFELRIEARIQTYSAEDYTPAPQDLSHST